MCLFIDYELLHHQTFLIELSFRLQLEFLEHLVLHPEQLDEPKSFSLVPFPLLVGLGLGLALTRMLVMWQLSVPQRLLNLIQFFLKNI